MTTALTNFREPRVSLSPNMKTGLILLSVVLVFFVGVIVRHWLWP